VFVCMCVRKRDVFSSCVFERERGGGGGGAGERAGATVLEEFFFLWKNRKEIGLEQLRARGWERYC